MRVLVVSNLFPPDVQGGYELGCGQLVAELAQRRHDVRVLTSSPRAVPYPGADPLVQRVLRVDDVWDDEMAARSDPRVRRATLARACLVDVHNLQLLHDQVENFSPDVVYLWNLVGVGGAGLAMGVQLLGVPWVWHLMDAVPVQLALPAGARRHDVARIFTERLTGDWIVCSLQLAEELTAGGGRLESRLEVVPNWVSGPRPQPKDDWYRGGRRLRCAFIGSLTETKGIDVLIDAAGELTAQSGADVVFDVYGSGARLGALEGQVAGRRLDGHIRFHGSVSHADLMRRLETHDLLLFPTSEREPFAFAPLEAAARGCVPVVTAGCANAEPFRDRTSILTAAREPTAFARIVREVLDGAIDLEIIGGNGMEKVWQDFPVERAADRVESILNDARGRNRHAIKPMPWDEVLELGRLAERVVNRALAL